MQISQRTLAARTCANKTVNKSCVLPRVAAPVRSVVTRFQPRDNDKHAHTEVELEEMAKMLCYQCEQTAHNTGCTSVGVCGKTAEVAGLQDLLIFSVKGLAYLADYARSKGISDIDADSYILRGTFSTLTNVLFHEERVRDYILEGLSHHARLSDAVASAGHSLPTPPAKGVTWFEPATGHPLTWNNTQAARLAAGKPMSLAEMNTVAAHTGIIYRQGALGKTIAGLQETICYGVKGMAAYAAHAEALGGKDPAVYASVAQDLAFLASPGANDVATLLEKAMQVGTHNLTVMQLLSDTHARRFGHPTPTEVPTVPVPGKAILVTGHDMHDLDLLLQQTEGTGINVYTHGEMLPAHGYPGLHKYPHLKGHYGGAWYKQKADFSKFPGPIVVTTNCVLEPLPSYKDRLFTLNETGVHNTPHLHVKDFSAVVKSALASDGFTQANMSEHVAPGAIKKASVTAGFGHHAVLGVADKVVGAIKEGKLKHIFLVGGCDGHEKERAYYGQLGEDMPKDTMVLTLGCGKYRLLDTEFGTLGDTGLPRLLDMGQCNDAIAAIIVATELAKAFNTDVNSLPLSLDLSWFEQKAVAVLLTLLSLGVKNIRLGPTLPAFLTQDAVNVLVDIYGLTPADVHHPKSDLQKMMHVA